MNRPDSAFSMNLERSMNMQIRITTFEEHLVFSKNIDELDDERRAKSFNLDKWNKDMQISFAKKRKAAIDSQDWKAMKALNEEIEEFNKVFFRKKKKMQKLEVYYEKKDDELRSWLIDYAVQCREKLRIENSNIERKLLKENMKKKCNKAKKQKIKAKNKGKKVKTPRQSWSFPYKPL